MMVINGYLLEMMPLESSGRSSCVNQAAALSAVLYWMNFSMQHGQLPRRSPHQLLGKKNAAVHGTTKCSEKSLRFQSKDHGMAILMVTWIPSIYPLDVTIFLAYMDPSWVIT